MFLLLSCGFTIKTHFNPENFEILLNSIYISFTQNEFELNIIYSILRVSINHQTRVQILDFKTLRALVWTSYTECLRPASIRIFSKNQR